MKATVDRSGGRAREARPLAARCSSRAGRELGTADRGLLLFPAWRVGCPLVV
jgi:hypothetical protein